MCFLGEKKAGSLSLSGQTQTPGNPLHIPRGRRMGEGWSQRKKTWGLAPSLTLKSLCPWVSHQASASVQLRGGCASVGAPPGSDSRPDLSFGLLPDRVLLDMAFPPHKHGELLRRKLNFRRTSLDLALVIHCPLASY